MSLHMQCEVILPDWLDSFVEAWPDPLATVEQRMRLAVALSDENVRHKTGGPFGAIVVEERSNRLLGVGVNLVTTLEAALAGGLILRGQEGAFRDLASMHGNYRRVLETERALALICQFLADLEVAEADWYLDRPVSNSGRLAAMIRTVAAAHGCWGTVQLVADPDPLLSAMSRPVVSSDSVILDACQEWANLAGEIISHAVPDAWILDFSVDR